MLYAIICRKLPFEGSDLTGSHRPRENVIRNRILHCEYAMDSRISEQAKGTPKIQIYSVHSDGI